MPSYTKERILHAQAPHTLFKSGDDFAEHKQILDGLSKEEQRALAEKIVLGCPQEQYRSLTQKIRALMHMGRPDDGFYSVMNHALSLAKHLTVLVDEKKDNPHLHVLSEGFELVHQACYQQFPTLVAKLLAGKEATLANRLKQSTPEIRHAELCDRLYKALSEESAFKQALQHTFKREPLTPQQQEEALTITLV